MAEVIDDWEFSSPPGSPYPSLPQSIWDVLESVKAECGIDDSEASHSSDVRPAIKWSNEPYKSPILNSVFRDFKTNRNISPAHPTQPSPVQKKITMDQELPDQGSSKVQSHPFYQSNVQKPRSSRESYQVHDDVEKYRNTHDEDAVMMDLENPAQPHQSSVPNRVEQPSLTPVYGPAEDGSPCGSNVSSQLGGKQAVDMDTNPNTSRMSQGLMNGHLNDTIPIKPPQSHPLTQSNAPEIANHQIGAIKNGLDLKGVQNNCGSVHADKEAETRLKSVGAHLAQFTVSPWCEPATDERNIEVGDHVKVKTATRRILENLSTTSICHNRPATRVVYGLSQEKVNNIHTVKSDTGIIEDKILTPKNGRQKEENQNQSKYDWFTKQVGVNVPTEMVDLTDSPNTSLANVTLQRETTGAQDDIIDRLIEDRIHSARIAAETLDMTDSPNTSKSVANVNLQRETTGVQDDIIDRLIEDRIRSARNALLMKEKKSEERGVAEFVDLTDSPKASKSVAGVGITLQQETSGVQGSCNVSRKSAGAGPNEKSLQLESYPRTSSCGSVTPTAADELDAVCYNDEQSPNETANMKMVPDNTKPGYEARADLRDIDFSYEESSKIKMENLSNDELQPNEAIAQSYTTEIKDETCNEHSKTNPVAIWKQELLSSDFNLMYGCLRAVLFGTISKEERNRLIHTMIATMSEIEQVTLHGKSPTQQSVRCETPELQHSVDENNSTEMQLSVKDEKPATRKRKRETGERSLRQKELILNQKRSELLMKKNADGSWTCLVCDMVRETAGNGVCRACLAFTYRIERAYTIGVPLPTCNHTKYSESIRCKSCRFRKFSFLSMTATDTRVREINEKTCPVCEETSYHFRSSWQCSKCYYFYMKLIRRPKRMPYCKHSGEYPRTCDGCRCYKLQLRWHEFDSRPYPLPIVKKHLFYKK